MVPDYVSHIRMTRLTPSRRILLMGILVAWSVMMNVAFCGDEATSFQAGTRKVQGWAAHRVNAESPSYIRAMAHAPGYDDPAIWHEGIEKTAHYKQSWEESPVLVWNVKDLKMSHRADPLDAENWLQYPAGTVVFSPSDGQKASHGPDENTDIVFTSGMQARIRETFACRHLTIMPGAKVNCGKVNVYGNVWIKKGGSFWRTRGSFGGSTKNTFARSDNDAIVFIPNNYRISRVKGVSLEWLGRWKLGDELRLNSGDFIIGPGAVWQHTDRRHCGINPDARLILMSGATYEARGNQYAGTDMDIKGALLAGTVERPLTRDCTIGLSFKAWTEADGQKAFDGCKKGDTALVLHRDAEMAVNSSDPEKARLVFRWHRNLPETRPLDDGKEPVEVATMHHGINMLLLGELKLNGVEFNDVRRGGIMLEDPSAVKRWRNVVIGARNDGKLSDLIGSPDVSNARR